MLNGQFGVFIIITGVFIAISAKSEIMASYIGERLDGITVGDLTWFGIAEAGTDMDADSMLWQRQRLGNAGAVAVLDDDGRLDGLVMEDQLWAIPSERRPMVMLTQLMVPFDKLAKASPDEELSAVLPRLNPLRPVVTVWNGDKLLGIVPPKRLEERLKQAQHSVLPRPRLITTRVRADPRGASQASATDQSRLATGSLSLHGKLIHRSVRFQM